MPFHMHERVLHVGERISGILIRFLSVSYEGSVRHADTKDSESPLGAQ